MACSNPANPNLENFYPAAISANSESTDDRTFQHFALLFIHNQLCAVKRSLRAAEMLGAAPNLPAFSRSYDRDHNGDSDGPDSESSLNLKRL